MGGVRGHCAAVDRAAVVVLVSYLMPRIKLWTNNRILRPSEMAERKSRKVGTSKRVAASMAARLVRRLAK